MISFSEWLENIAIIYVLIQVVIGIYNWYTSKRFLKVSGFLAWSDKTFRSRVAFTSTIIDHAAALSTENLIWVLRLGDHTRTAKDLISTELYRRGVSDLEVSAWMPQPVHITALSKAPVPASVEECRRMARWRNRFFVIYRLLAFPLFLICLPGLMQVDGRPLNEGLEGVAQVLLYLIMLFASVAVLIQPTRSLRVLLLRPFGNPRLTPALRRFVTHHLGPIATTYTLSDKTYRPNCLARMFERSSDQWRAITGALSRPPRILMSIWNERTFLRLASRLPRVIGPSFKTFVVGDQALTIKATNESWQLVIDMLMHSLDLIVIDVSGIGQSSAWEISHIFRRGLEENCIYVCEEEYEQRGITALQRLKSDFDPGEVHLYTGWGRLKDKCKFDTELNERLDRAVLRRENYRAQIVGVGTRSQRETMT